MLANCPITVVNTFGTIFEWFNNIFKTLLYFHFVEPHNLRVGWEQRQSYWIGGRPCTLSSQCWWPYRSMSTRHMYHVQIIRVLRAWFYTSIWNMGLLKALINSEKVSYPFFIIFPFCFSFLLGHKFKHLGHLLLSLGRIRRPFFHLSTWLKKVILLHIF